MNGMSDRSLTPRLPLPMCPTEIGGLDDITEFGVTVMPVTSLGLSHRVADQRITTGIARLDNMLQGRGTFAAARS
jgi:hypothetical protein